MGFYETPVRRLHLVRAGGALVLAIAFAIIPFVALLPASGRVQCFVGSGICGIAACVFVALSRRTPPGKTEYALPDVAPPAERLRMYRQLLWVSAVAFPILAAAVAFQLHELESGAQGSARIWAPLVPIYEHLGFWPAVLAPLVLGAVCCTVFLVKLGRPARK